MANNIQIGTISEIDNKKGLAIVVTDGRSTDWLPIIYPNATKNKKSSISLSVGDQILLLNPFGENKDGFVLGGLYYEGMLIPSGANDDTEVIEYSDGTVVSFDLKGGLLKVDSPSNITIICQNAKLTADSIHITGDTTIDGDLKVTGTIDDKKGTLTNHKHSVKDHSEAVPRP